MDEAKKRDYKDEYKKFQSSPKSKKYRAELNKYNRKKGTYGNGDGKDASHKGGKISGFEKESVNRGRREKSRLKKEQKLREVIRKIIDEDFAGAHPEHQRKSFDGKRRKQSEVFGYKLTGVNDVKTEIDDATVKEGNVGISTKKGKSIELTHRKSGKEIVVVNNPSVLKKYAKMGYLISMPEGKLNESGIMYKAGVKKYGKDGMTKIQSAAGKDKGHEEIGKIKDKYEKGKKEGVREAKESSIDIARRIVKDKQHEQGVDMQTASLILQLYNAYKKYPNLQKKLEKLPLKKMVQNIWRFAK